MNTTENKLLNGAEEEEIRNLSELTNKATIQPTTDQSPPNADDSIPLQLSS